MAIQVQKRPFSYAFSGNPVHYQLYSALAAGDDSIFFEVRLMFKNVGGSYEPTEALPYSPYNGVATLDVQDILEGLLDAELPEFNSDETTIYPAPGQTGSYYLQFREITSTNQEPSWDDSESVHEGFIVKGGISRFKYQGNNFWVNYFGLQDTIQPSPFLTWQVSERLAAVNERMFLLFLHVQELDAFKVSAKVTYTDGTTLTVNKVFTDAEKGVPYYIPAGANQWSLENSAKSIHFWEIVVKNNTTGVAISKTFTYYADNRNNYNLVTLHYRNSLGGLDSLPIRGVIEYNNDYDYSELGKVTAPNYFSGHYFAPQKIISNNKELQTMRSNSGPLGKEEQDRLRDVFIKRETWWAVEGKWWPVNITTKNYKQKSTEDSLWSLPIDFSLAHDGDTNYTPFSVNLGTSVATEVDNVCQAYLSPITYIVDLSNGGLNDGNSKVTASFTEVDPENAAAQFRYRVMNGSLVTIDWVTKNIGTDNPFSFVVPSDIFYSLETQAICGNQVPGRKTTETIDTTDAAPEEPTPVDLTNTMIRNNTSMSTVCKVYINNSLYTTVFLGANNNKMINLPALSDALFSINMSSLSASSATLDGVPASPSGFTCEWNHVTKPDGFTIEIY
jgi:hypothetical protein